MRLIKGAILSASISVVKGSYYCTCDISTKCDYNCCCDVDCTQVEKDLFSNCATMISDLNRPEYCSFSQIIATKAEVLEVSQNSNSQFCIKTSANEDGWSFKEIDSLSKEKIGQIIELSDQNPNWPSPSDTQTPATYLSGSQLAQLDTVTGNVKPFGFPGSKFSRICTESPIRFKVDQEDSCLTKNNEANCLLIGQQAFTNIQVDESGDETTFNPPVIACFDNAGSSISCSNSNFAASTCQNAIVNSRYIIRTDADTGYISQVRLELTLEDVASTWIKRESQIEFIRDDSNPDSIIRLSGRPGYQIGKPIRLVDFTSELSSLSDGDVYEMEIMSHSSCSNAAIRSKTQFEKDQFVSCYIDFSMGGGDCSVAQNVVDGIVGIDRSGGGLAVGKWGDSAGCSGAASCGTKWTNVLEASAPNACSGFSLATGKHYKVLYQKTGSILDPQTQIVGVRIEYSSESGTTTDGVNYRYRLSSSVTYIDVSSRPSQLFAKPPPINIEIPANFLYPFKKVN